MPQLIERIITDLNKSGRCMTCAMIARDYLGLGLIDEAKAEAVVGPLLDADPRLVRGPTGWMSIARTGSRRKAVPADFGENSESHPPLDAAFLALFAPRDHSSHALMHSASQRNEARYIVALGGRRELARARARGLVLPCEELPIVHVYAVARRLGIYHGPHDLAAIALALGVPHLDGYSLDDAASMIVGVWKKIAETLSSHHQIADLAALERMLDEKLERTDFSRKGFGTYDLAQIGEGPGVYLFREAGGSALYVGRSRRLKARVCSYFSGPPRDSKDKAIRERSHFLETKSLDTALDAMLVEAPLIRRWSPILNTQRGVHQPPPEDGIALLPTPTAERWIAYVVSAGALRCRRVLRGSIKQRQLAARRTVAALGHDHRAGPAAREAASLIAAWLKVEPQTSWLTPISAAGPEALARKLVSETTETCKVIVDGGQW